jgi:hypothetical protein
MVRSGHLVGLVYMCLLAGGATPAYAQEKWLELPKRQQQDSTRWLKQEEAAAAATESPAESREAEKERILRAARAKEATAVVTVENARERLELWKQVRLIDPNELEAQLGYQRAERDLETARQQEEQQAQEEAAASGEQEVQARRADQALQSGDLEAAEEMADDLLSRAPGNVDALRIKKAVRVARAAKAFRFWLILGAGLLLVVAIVVAIFARRGLKRLRQRDQMAGSEGGGKAVLKIVDGIGRGRIVTVDKEIFRIGAAQGTKPDEINDLILSDSGSLVSRFHCSIIQHGEEYLLVDSSTNGTELNGEPLVRGEDRRLRDGDELVVASVSRLKFLVT